MIVGNKNILAWMEANGNPYWTLKHSKADNGSPVAMSLQEPSLSMSDSISRLASYFGMLGNKGQYYIITRKSHEDKGAKGVFNDYVELGADSDAGQHVAGIGGFNPQMNGFVSSEDVKRQIHEALESHRRETEITTLREELAEQKRINREQSKNTLDERFSRIMGIMEPYIPNLLGMAKGAPTAVGIAGVKKQTTKPNNQVAQQTTETATTEQIALSERYQAVMEELSTIFERHDMTLISVMEQLVKNAHEDEDRFIMMTKMIF